MTEIEITRNEYDRFYKAEGFAAQRLYPNEELLRFLGRRFFSRFPRGSRGSLPVLEVGCGSGANLWMLAREGFDTHGLELSTEAILLCRQMLGRWGASATLHEGSMTAMPLPAEHFAAVVDVFSSNCLTLDGFRGYLSEVRRVLRPDGVLFSYTPSQASDAWTRYSPSVKLDEYTLNGILRSDSPFSGNLYPFRFETPEHIDMLLATAGMRLRGCERIGRTYHNGSEYFEFLSYEATRD